MSVEDKYKIPERERRRWILFVAIGAILVAAFAILIRSAEVEPKKDSASAQHLTSLLPASFHPWADSGSVHSISKYVGSDEAPQTDVQDTRRRARVIVNCIQQAHLENGAEALLKRSAGEQSPELQQLNDEDFEVLQKKLAHSPNSEECAGADMGSLQEDVYPALLAAGETGDQDAASCYVFAEFELSPSQMQAPEIESYRTHALAFVEEGIARGDWRFVDLAANASGFFFHKNKDWFGQLMPRSDEMQYRYLKLEEYGADGEFAESIGVRLTAIRGKLNADAIERGDQWASFQFETHFTQSGHLSSVPQICEMHGAK